jgi:hypothetical protein
MQQAQLRLCTPLQEYSFFDLEANPFQEMMKSLMSQNNPLMMAKSFKKKPNPKYNKPQ